jgi:hypothetical protein
MDAPLRLGEARRAPRAAEEGTIIGNFHLVGQLARERHEELICEAEQARPIAAVAGPSLRTRVARSPGRPGDSATPGAAAGAASTTLRARPLSGAGD